ncbi:RPM1 interacting protein 13 [Linum grandiflorum]
MTMNKKNPTPESTVIVPAPKAEMPITKKKQPPEDIVTIPDSDSDGTPLRPIFCLKMKNGIDMRKFEEIDDCFIVDFDPDDLNRRPVDPNPEIPSPGADVVMVSEKGPVACRDYPHSRYQCAAYPFDKTPHQKYCPRCYCYVCDVAAPCKFWEVGATPHCHAKGHVLSWRLERAKMRVLQQHG